MNLTFLDHFFWAAGFLGHLALLFVLWHRHRIKHFPFFTALLSLAALRTVVLFFVLRYGNKTSYFFTYWLLGIADTTVQLSVVYELMSHVFRPLQGRSRAGHSHLTRLLGMGVLSLGLAAGLTWLAHPPAHSWMQSLATRGNLFAASLMSELFVGLMVLAVNAGAPWKAHAACIAVGLGAYSLMSVLIETGHSYFGVGEEVPAFFYLSYLRMTTYLACVIYWIIQLWPDERPALSMPLEMREKLFTLQARVAYSLDVLRARDKL